MSQTLSLISQCVGGFIIGPVTFVEIGQSRVRVCLQRDDLKQLSSREQEHAAQSDRWALPARGSHQWRSSTKRGRRAEIRRELGAALCTNSHNCWLYPGSPPYYGTEALFCEPSFVEKNEV